jgi:hypothetical protein
MANLTGHAAETWEEFFEDGGEPGTWFKASDITNPEEPRTCWHTIPPCGHIGFLHSENHHVTEHDDGTITVDPSIWCHSGGESHNERCWHGFLRKGVWREC